MNGAPVGIGINGFGRIGRAVARIIYDDQRFQLRCINDITEAAQNLAYLYNYDSVYGRARPPADIMPDGQRLKIGEDIIPVICKESARDVPWHDMGVDIIIDASGVAENIEAAHDLVAQGQIKKAIITHSPDTEIDRYIVMGVNDDCYDASRDHVVSSSICDANAIGHVLKAIDQLFGIDTGTVTTLHPWLSYQNLVDGPLANQSKPGHNWPDYSLGRSSINALIPKQTTAVRALRPILEDIPDRLDSFSYRVPTSIVSSADMNLIVREDVSDRQLADGVTAYFASSPYVSLNHHSLTSVDYIQEPWSAVIDMQWARVHGKRMIKMIAWYDNEWGYSSRVRDVAALVAGLQH